LDLKHILEMAALTRPPSDSKAIKLRRSWILINASCAGLLLLAIVFSFRRAAPPIASVRLNLSFEGLSTSLPRPSPDGKFFAYVGVDSSGKQSLWLRPLNSERSRPLPGTEDASSPFWSADGRWLGFWSNGKIRKIDPAGGAPLTIGDFPLPPTTGVAWNGKGDILLATPGRRPLYRMSEADGSSKLIPQLDVTRTENSHRWPVFAPDGNHFYFVSRCIQPQYTSLYLGSLDSGQTRRLMHVESNVEYLAGRNDQSASLLSGGSGDARSGTARHRTSNQGGEIPGE
jgi:hypothetical protein